MERRGIGKPCIALFITGLVLIMILILFETGIFSQVSSFGLAVIFKKKTMVDEVEDEDVGKEREKVKNTRREDLLKNNIIVTEDLTKFYGSHLAVNKICLAIKKSECFGLLGVNGAGKTTTFKILTGDIAATSGEGWVNGYSLKRHMNKVRKHIGYCPQFDAFLEILTVRDTLHLFALIRGVPSSRCDRTIEQLAKDFDFEQHVDKQVTHLSGGNKRKLSSALALLGDPSVIYLDEPTAGMDPATKKYLVNGLTKIRDSGKCIVLTSHNLEEAEALCTRVAIMVNGRFQCLGSIQHLKNKFAKGFFFTIKIQRQLNQGARRNRETKQLPRMPASP